MTEPTVTQADREAMAAVYADKAAGYAAEIRGGLHDGLPLLQAFARHRTASAPADLVEALQAAEYALESARQYFLHKQGSRNPARDEALEKVRAALKHGGA